MDDENGLLVRQQLLELARQILSENIHVAREERDVSKSSYYTTEDVINEAKKLYDFVKRHNEKNNEK